MSGKDAANRNEEMAKSILDVMAKNGKTSQQVSAKVYHMVECLSDQNQFNDLEQVKKWFEKKVKECPMSVEKINLNDVKGGWKIDDKTGNLVHESGGFFSVIGLRITNTSFREAGKGWDQPIMDQGTESSVNAILRKKFNGIYHYLIQAKAEPGNYGKLQFSPTLQATFSNLNQAHKGRKPLFYEIYDERDKYNVLYAQWLPEDGGRFYLKRIYNMLVEVPEDKEIPVPDNFIWLTMYQIKELLKQDNVINPHVRSIIAHL